MPLMKPAVITVAILSFNGAWNDFLGPLLYINDEKLYTLQIGLQTFKGTVQTQWHYLMSASVLVLLPVILIFFFFNGTLLKAPTLPLEQRIKKKRVYRHLVYPFFYVSKFHSHPVLIFHTGRGNSLHIILLKEYKNDQQRYGSHREGRHDMSILYRRLVEKNCIPTCGGLTLSSVVAIKGHIKSPQWVMKVSRATVINTGFDNGITI